MHLQEESHRDRHVNCSEGHLTGLLALDNECLVSMSDPSRESRVGFKDLIKFCPFDSRSTVAAEVILRLFRLSHHLLFHFHRYLCLVSPLSLFLYPSL